MKRLKFILSCAATLATPLFVFGGRQDEAKPKKRIKGFLIKANESRFSEKLISGKNQNDLKVSSTDTSGDLTIFEYTGNDKGGPPLHIHFKQDEVFYILEGEYLFQVGDEKFTAKSGDTVFAPRQVPHAFAQISNRGKMFYLFQPSGKMEDFFRKLAAVSGILTPEQGAKIFAEHDMKVVGPPLQF